MVILFLNQQLGKLLDVPVVFLGVVIVTVLILSLGGRFFDTYGKEIYEKHFLPEKKKEIKHASSDY